MARSLSPPGPPFGGVIRTHELEDDSVAGDVLFLTREHVRVTPAMIQDLRHLRKSVQVKFSEDFIPDFRPVAADG